jgi:hypothetical protein
MEIPEYTISPTLFKAMEEAFTPFAECKVNGMPLAQWIAAQDAKLNKPWPDPMLATMLANTLENLFMLEGNGEGHHLLQALDGIIHNGGEPALIIRGVPNEGPLSPIIREAFRQRMFVDTGKAMPYQPHMKDVPVRFEATGFRRGSYSALHQDDEDITLLFGVTGGTNPRHTVVMTLDEYYERVAAGACASGAKVTADMVRELASLPIWILDPTLDHTAGNPIFHGQRNEERIARANALGLIRVGLTEQGFERFYAPLVYPNPQYHAGEKNSARDQLLLAPEGHFRQRIEPDRTAVPQHLLPVLDACVASMREVVLNQGEAAKQGPVLHEGDALIINNRVLLHAGGAHVHDRLPLIKRCIGKLSPREIVAVDVAALPPETYGVRPGDRAAQPISYTQRVDGQRVAQVDPSVVTR